MVLGGFVRGGVWGDRNKPWATGLRCPPMVFSAPKVTFIVMLDSFLSDVGCSCFLFCVFFCALVVLFCALVVLFCVLVVLFCALVVFF